MEFFSFYNIRIQYYNWALSVSEVGRSKGRDFNLNVLVEILLLSPGGYFASVNGEKDDKIWP